MSIIYEKDVTEPWFSYIVDIKKTVEGRLNKGDWTHMEFGDQIVWKSPGWSCRSLVIKAVEYDSFEEYLKAEGLEKTLPGVETIEEGIDVYRQFYSVEDEQKYGVIAIHLCSCLR